MGLFSSVLSAAVDTVRLPLAVAGEAVGLREEGASKQVIEDLQEDIENALESIGDGDLI